MANNTNNHQIAIDNLLLEEKYKEALTLLNEDLLDNAISLFLSLVKQKPYEKKYWFQYAIALQINENYEKALNVWHIISTFDHKDPTPHMYAHECFSKLKRENLAMLAIEKAKKLCRREFYSTPQLCKG